MTGLAKNPYVADLGNRAHTTQSQNWVLTYRVSDDDTLKVDPSRSADHLATFITGTVASELRDLATDVEYQAVRD